MPATHTHTLTRRVEFSDTDLAGIMHFSNFFRFMESVEHDFYRTLGLKLTRQMPDGSTLGWPRVNASCEYKRPLKFEDLVDVTLKVAKKTGKAITYDFIFCKRGETEECARGSLTIVCCAFRDGKLQATLLPKEWDEKIELCS